MRAAGGLVALLAQELPTFAVAEYTATRTEVQTLRKLVESDASFRDMLRSAGINM